MKNWNTLLFVAAIEFFIFILPLFAGAQSPLSYQQLTNGLDDPYFEGGRTDFRMNDINMDGNIDILTIGDHGSPNVGTNQHGICVWFGDGQGNFENFMFGNFGYGGISVMDVNNDGFKDVGYGMHHNYSSTDLGDQILEVALGDGTGMSWTAWDDGLATNGETWGMFGTDFGDVDNDGDPDLVSISFGSGAGLHVYLNQGDGTWDHSFGFLDGNSNMLVEFGDFNRDGFLDFMASHQYGTIYFGDGTGDFVNNDAGLPVLGTFDARRGISVADVNNDGASDIAFVNSNSGVEVYYWDDGDSQSWNSISGDLPQSGNFDLTDLADMNCDGFIDLIAMGDESISIWLGDGEGNWAAETEFTIADNANPKAFRVGGDLDQNGKPDMVMLAETGNWPSYQNHFFCFRESSPADSLFIRPQLPKGGENFYPGSVQFIRWASEVPAGGSSLVTIEASAFGQSGPWWLVAGNIPNNGEHQWTIPDYGSGEVYLKFTVIHGADSATAITPAAFRIYGNPTGFAKQYDQPEASVFPNPGGDCFYISKQEAVQTILLTDVAGSICFHTSDPSGKIEVKHLPKGIYFYKLWMNDGSLSTGKWIKGR
jgi:hypothetical protein